MRKFDELAEHLMDFMGGEDNITFFTHCVTRLRFNVKDKSKVRQEDIAKVQGVIGALWSGEQYQIIIGQEVGDAYALICEKTGLKGDKSVVRKKSPWKKKRRNFQLT